MCLLGAVARARRSIVRGVVSFFSLRVRHTVLCGQRNEEGQSQRGCWCIPLQFSLFGVLRYSTGGSERKRLRAASESSLFRNVRPRPSNNDRCPTNGGERVIKAKPGRMVVNRQTGQAMAAGAATPACVSVVFFERERGDNTE